MAFVSLPGASGGVCGGCHLLCRASQYREGDFIPGLISGRWHRCLASCNNLTAWPIVLKKINPVLYNGVPRRL